MTTELSTAPLGDVGTKLLHEDDRVRIWEIKLQPGEETPPHRHELDYYIIIIDGDGIAAAPHVLSTGASAEYIGVENIKRGDIVPMEKGGVELARNIGTKPFYEILVELKNT
jgi:predicted metal-dependent enzyme (double-stranded beta helix superfamily)